MDAGKQNVAANEIQARKTSIGCGNVLATSVAPTPCWSVEGQQLLKGTTEPLRRTESGSVYY